MPAAQFYGNIILRFYILNNSCAISNGINDKDEEIITLLFQDVLDTHMNSQEEGQESFLERLFGWFWNWYAYITKTDLPRNKIEELKQEILDLFCQGNKQHEIYKKLQRMYLLLKNCDYDEIANKLQEIIDEICNKELILEVKVPIEWQENKVCFDNVNNKLQEILKKKSQKVAILYHNKDQVYVTAEFFDPIMYREVFLPDVSYYSFSTLLRIGNANIITLSGLSVRGIAPLLPEKCCDEERINEIITNGTSYNNVVYFLESTFEAVQASTPHDYNALQYD